MVYANFVYSILLSDEWGIETIQIITIIPIGLGLKMIATNYVSMTHNAVGKPHRTLIFDGIHLATCALAFMILVFVKPNLTIIDMALTKVICQIIFAIEQFIVARVFYSFKVEKTLKCVFPAVVCTVLMVVFALFLQAQDIQNLKTDNLILYYIYNAVSIILCAVLYFALFAVLFKRDFKDMKTFFKSKEDNKVRKEALIEDVLLE
jgi:hypothetical protein